jgi:hypothetical protein
MVLQLYGISKNDAKKNPVEQFQRDVENKEVFIRYIKTELQFLPCTDTETYGIGCLIKTFFPHILHSIAAIEFYRAQ